MERKKVEEKVLKIIKKNLLLKEVVPTMMFSDIADSLDRIELQMEFEDCFKISIPDEIEEGWILVDDITTYIHSEVK